LLKAVFASLLCLVLVPWPALSQGTKKAAPKKAAAKSKPAATQGTKKAVPQKKAAAKSKKKKSTRRVVRRPRTQPLPTPERYREIQQALVQRGYLQQPATGIWGPDSVAALKKYQADQKLGATGKLDALSLIRLGLGPQRDVASQNGRLPPAEAKAEP